MKSILKNIVAYTLRVLAQLTLFVHRPTIIAVTGNIGKTSVKDAVAATLGTTYHIRASDKSFNSEIGVPLTILGEKNQWSNVLGWILVIIRSALRLIVRESYPTHLVLEVGADKPGDIRTVTEWVKPHVAILTQFGEVPVHIENFNNDRTLVVREKAYLPQALRKGGMFVYYGDDVDTQGIANTIQHTKQTFGFREGNDVHILKTEFLYEDSAVSGMRYSIRAKQGEYSIIKKGFLGNTYAVACAAAIAVGELFDVNKEVTEKALSAYEPEPGRMRVLKGVKDSVIIDDTYNAAPKAMHHALTTLQGIDVQGKKIAILGDMLELGKHTEKAHKEIGQLAASACHTLVTVGLRARFIAQGALLGSMKDEHIFQFEDSRSAGKFVETIIEKNDIVLCKGSQGIRMEKAVEELLFDPREAELVLPRQSTEWKTR